METWWNRRRHCSFGITRKFTKQWWSVGHWYFCNIYFAISIWGLPNFTLHHTIAYYISYLSIAFFFFRNTILYKCLSGSSDPFFTFSAAFKSSFHFLECRNRLISWSFQWRSIAKPWYHLNHILNWVVYVHKS